MTEELKSFIYNIANLPAGTTAVCALVVYPDKLAPDGLEQIRKFSMAEKNLSVQNFESIENLRKKLVENSEKQTLKMAYPLLCLISQNEFAKNSFDEFSPLVFKIGLSNDKPNNG